MTERVLVFASHDGDLGADRDFLRRHLIEIAPQLLFEKFNDEIPVNACRDSIIVDDGLDAVGLMDIGYWLRVEVGLDE